MTFWEKVSQFGFEVLVFIVLAATGIIVWAVMGSKTVKTWQKTALMVVVTQAIAGVIGLLSWNSGHVGLRILAAILGVAFLIGCIYGHRKNWKQPGD